MYPVADPGGDKGDISPPPDFWPPSLTNSFDYYFSFSHNIFNTCLRFRFRFSYVCFILNEKFIIYSIYDDIY